jgi:branched-subunit amino acid ABC-type transport system permease component
MRSVSHDREAAAMMGVDIDRTIMMAFFIGSLLAGVAGVMADSSSAAFSSSWASSPD